ncbi:MAG: SDR family oxidoreductase [Kiloniellales bacterium]
MSDPPATPPRLFCFGLGYTGLALARRLMAEGWQVAGTTRSQDKGLALAAMGIEVTRFDRDLGFPDPRPLMGAGYILSAVPPDREGDPVIACVGPDLATLAERGAVRWVGYLSTTGVYGDRGGGWVDETSALEPTGARGRRRLAAERAWLGLWRQHGLPVHLFRLAGIYGPGRGAIEAVRAGTARRIDKPGQVFSRIHVDDLVAALRASMDRPDPGSAYNLCDDDPAPPADVIAYACKLLGVEAPPLIRFEDAELSAMGRSFYRDNKRVRNRRIKETLGVRLKYPDYKAGLEAILAAERTAPRRRGRRR